MCSFFCRMEYKILHIFNKVQCITEGVPFTNQRAMSSSEISLIKHYWEDSIQEVKKKKGFAAYLTGPPSSLSNDKCQIVLFLPKVEKVFLTVFKWAYEQNDFFVCEESFENEGYFYKWLENKIRVF